jgi:Family of unknown function (DUF6188)
MAKETFSFLAGRAVEQVEFSGPIRLVFERRPSEPETYVEFLQAQLAEGDGAAIEFDGFEARDRAGVVLRLLWQRVAAAEAEDGVLRISFEKGDVLTAPPDNEFESWSVYGSPGTFQCLAGGEVASWG